VRSSQTTQPVQIRIAKLSNPPTFRSCRPNFRWLNSYKSLKNPKEKELGKAILDGVYDFTENQGWVSVAIDHDTARFAAEAIRRWRKKMGSGCHARSWLPSISNPPHFHGDWDYCILPKRHKKQST